MEPPSSLLGKAVGYLLNHRLAFSRVLADGLAGPRKTRYQRREEDPEALDIDFRFKRFAEVRPDVFASDHCPVAFEVP